MQTYDCTYCPLKTEKDLICIDYQIRADLGWEFFQKDVDKTSYQYVVKLFTRQSAKVHPYISLPAFAYNDYLAELQEFKAVFAFEAMTFKKQKLFCISIYGDLELLWAKVKMTLKITECYAILINCFWNWQDWTDRLAQLLDNCSLSKDTEVILYEFKTDYDPWYIMGAKQTVLVQGGDKCIPGFNEIIPIWRDVEVFGQSTGTTLLANLFAYIEAVAPGSISSDDY
jgi:hypothetical protein